MRFVSVREGVPAVHPGGVKTIATGVGHDVGPFHFVPVRTGTKWTSTAAVRRAATPTPLGTLWPGKPSQGR